MGTTQANLNISSAILINSYNSISAGISAGFAQSSIRNENFRWGSQFENGIYNQNLSAGEIYTVQPFNFIDANAGVNWNYTRASSDVASTGELRLNAGLAAFHLNRPQQKFTASVGDKLHTKYVAHAGALIGIKQTGLSLLPSAIFFMQGEAREVNFGLLGRLGLEEKEMAISIGGYFRYLDAIIPSVMLEFSSFALGITYDVNISQLTTVSNNRGGVELSLRYINPNPFTSGKAASKVKFL